MSDDGDWWNRAREVKERPRNVTRNDYLADLWSSQGWGDDDLWAGNDGPDIGQEAYKTRDFSSGRSRRKVWSEPRSLQETTAQRAIVAHGMVQTFVDAFTTRDYGYRVVFDPNVGTAATSFAQRLIVLDPAPIFDTTITASQCGLILTAMAVHEVGHVLYDQETRAAVSRAFTGASKPLALRVSNILSDMRLELRFADRYPGYSDVFEPALQYVSRASHGAEVRFDANDPANFVCAAIRYHAYLTWTPELEAERDWWLDLARRASLQDGGTWHVKHVREAMTRLDALGAKYPAPPPPDNGDQPDDGDPSDGPRPHPFVP
jgi:hypothetical protein